MYNIELYSKSRDKQLEIIILLFMAFCKRKYHIDTTKPTYNLEKIGKTLCQYAICLKFYYTIVQFP